MKNYICPKPSCQGRRLNRVSGTIKYMCFDCKDTYIQDDSGRLIKEGSNPKKLKYGNIRVKIDGILFDSQLEADYYVQLKWLHRSGEIAGFSIQPRFLLTTETETEKKSEYVADFDVKYNDSTYEVIDTKGMKTDGYKQKIKQFKAKYPNIKFKEVSREEIRRT